MTTTIVKEAEEQRVARSIVVLAPLIMRDLEQAREASERAGLPVYRAAGEKLLEAKAQLPHGEFVAWVTRNFGISRVTTSRYMKLAGATTPEMLSARNISSLRGAMRETGGNEGGTRPGWAQPVQKIVSRLDTELLNMRRDEMRRMEERQAQRDLALTLIQIGYRVLARKLHPDRGGSREAMARLNEVRNRLKGCA